MSKFVKVDPLEKKFSDGFKMAQSKHDKTPASELLKHTIPLSHGLSARLLGWNAGIRTLRRTKIAQQSYCEFWRSAQRKLAKRAKRDARVKELINQ